MANIQINIVENGTTTLATSGCICDRNIDINVDVPTGGGEGYVPTDAELTYTGTCDYVFSNDKNKWVIDNYGSRITTSDIEFANSMFQDYTGETIPFTINFTPKNSTTINESMFYRCPNLKELPVINNLRMGAFSNNFINHCDNIRKISMDTFPNIDFSYYQSYAYGRQNSLISYCCALREIDKEFLDGVMNLDARNSPTYSYWFESCYSLDELKDLYVTNKELTSNIFAGFASNCYRLKTFTFATDNGVPKVAKWKNQTIDLSGYIGYLTSKYSTDYVTGYNSGITEDKAVTDDTTYQALKNDPDWFTGYIAYSRFNHDSAVETINSLPDTSAYGGGNTIKFKGAAGSATDGGAINTLTEEEIAVATAKGWTVTIV